MRFSIIPLAGVLFSAGALAAPTAAAEPQFGSVTVGGPLGTWSASPFGQAVNGPLGSASYGPTGIGFQASNPFARKIPWASSEISPSLLTGSAQPKTQQPPVPTPARPWG
jgi:hypothetical protein